MADWNHHIRTKFVQCTLIAQTYDIHRKRNVNVYQVPHEWRDVGVSDGIDCWVCPLIANAFGVDVKKILADILDGTPPKLPVKVGRQGTTQRKRIAEFEEAAAEVQPPQTQIRRRVIVRI